MNCKDSPIFVWITHFVLHFIPVKVGNWNPTLEAEEPVSQLVPKVCFLKSQTLLIFSESFFIPEKHKEIREGG